MNTKLQQISYEQTVRLLASDDLELFGAELNREQYAAIALAMAEFIVMLRSNRQASLLDGLRLWQIYKEAKRKVQQKAGAGFAWALSSMGGGRLCDKLDYCRRKAHLHQLFDLADSDEAQVLIKQGTKVAMDSKYAETIKEICDFLNETAAALAEVAAEAAEEVADNIIPISFVFMISKYALDELCKCCNECGGSGSINGLKPCTVCGGKGHRRA
jgi:hypothetical protein